MVCDSATVTPLLGISISVIVPSAWTALVFTPPSRLYVYEIGPVPTTPPSVTVIMTLKSSSGLPLPALGTVVPVPVSVIDPYVAAVDGSASTSTTGLPDTPITYAANSVRAP
jgi:hypothetical protein